jgi:hypothetical protein
MFGWYQRGTFWLKQRLGVGAAITAPAIPHPRQHQAQAMTNTKKRHHFIPVTYLEKFTDPAGKVFAYQCDRPGDPLHIQPDNIGFERYYYAQPLPDGGRDTNRLEDFFSVIEGSWTPLHRRLRKGEADATDIGALATFLTLTRVRVPAMREAVESMLARHVDLVAHDLDRQGLLPPKPPGAEHILDNMAVAIDPHQSLHAMPKLAQGFGRVLGNLCFEVLHNETGVRFITSDNPVAYFNPSIPELRVLPYVVTPPDGPIELLFPIDPDTMLRGHVGSAPIRHAVLSDPQMAKRFNRLIARFAYRLMFASDRSADSVIAKHSKVSPIMEFPPAAGTDEAKLNFTFGFGPRPKLPKWKS